MSDIARAIGDIEGTLRSLKEQQANYERTAAEGRRILRDKIDAMSTQVHHLTGVAYGVQQDTAEIKKDIDEKIMPTIEQWQLRRARLAGMLDAGKVLWGIILAVCTAIGFVIGAVIKYLGILPNKFH